MQRIITQFSRIILFILCNASCFAQSLDQVIEPLDSVSRKYPVEKVHLHLDKTNYSFGEMIWFKAYVTDESNLPSMLSRILYVDLVDQELSVVSSLKLSVTAGLTSGNILVDTTMKKGDYELRAYTSWMRNYGEESFFNQGISIGNIASRYIQENRPGLQLLKSVEDTLYGKVPSKFSEDKIKLQFFPEGGHLVDGVRSKVAFRATGSNGLGIPVSGYVVNEHGLRVAEFESEYAGIGSFMLSPYNSKYTAVVLWLKGERKFLLPESEKKGYVLQVLGEDKEKFQVRITSGTNVEKNADLVIIARSGIQTQYVLRFKLTGAFIDVPVLKKDLPEGVIQLSLVDQGNLPVAERLIYNRSGNQLDFRLNDETDQYKVNQRIKMQWATSTNEDLNTMGSFSISVTKLNSTPVADGSEQTILSNLLLKSELRGQIENPGYYFIDTSADRRKHLDQLLLTQDWYRWTVKEILAGTLPTVLFRPEKGLSVSGTVLFSGRPVIEGKVSLFAPGAGIPIDTITDQSGRFNFDRLVFPDGTRFVVQARSAKGRDNVQILMDIEPAPTVHSLMKAAQHNNLQYSDRQTGAKDGQDIFANSRVLEEVIVRAVKDPRKVDASSKLGHTNADFVFRPSQLSGTNLGDALIGKVLGLEVIHDPRTHQTFAYLRRNKLLSGNPRMRMYVFIDGVDYGYDLSMVTMSEIATVEVLKGGASAALYGDKGFGGVIIVTTKTFGERTEEAPVPAQGIIQYTPKGFSAVRQFYSPEYDKAGLTSNKPDVSSTLYWNPEIVQKDGKIEFEFSAGYRPGLYRMVIEGIDKNGRPGRKAYIFNIQE